MPGAAARSRAIVDAPPRSASAMIAHPPSHASAPPPAQAAAPGQTSTRAPRLTASLRARSSACSSASARSWSACSVIHAPSPGTPSAKTTPAIASATINSRSVKPWLRGADRMRGILRRAPRRGYRQDDLGHRRYCHLTSTIGWLTCSHWGVPAQGLCGNALRSLTGRSSMSAHSETRRADAESRVSDADGLSMRLWLRLLACTTMIERHVREQLRIRFDLTLPRFDLMAQLARAPKGLRMSDLSQRLMVTGGNITGLTD